MSVNQGEVYFRLFGDNFDPDSASEYIGIKATRTKRKGTPFPRTNSWEVSTGKVVDEVVDIYDMSSNLVTKLEPKAREIAEFIRTHNLEAVLQVVLHITMDDTKSTPAIGFESKTLAFLCAVGARIDVDTYRNAS